MPSVIALLNAGWSVVSRAVRKRKTASGTRAKTLVAANRSWDQEVNQRTAALQKEISEHTDAETRLLQSLRRVDGLSRSQEELLLPGNLQAKLTRTSPKHLTCRVLLAEDITDNQRLIGSLLREAGVDVAVANNGQEAVALVLATRPGSGCRPGPPPEPFDVILMDMQMPVLDGYGAIRRLRQAGYAGPIIALTALRGDRQKCRDAGCDDCLTSPIDQRLLLETVNRWGPAAPKPAEAQFTGTAAESLPALVRWPVWVDFEES